MSATRESEALAERFLAALNDIYKPTGAVIVLMTPNKRIEGRLPADAIKFGDIDDLIILTRWAESCADGNFA